MHIKYSWYLIPYPCRFKEYSIEFINKIRFFEQIHNFHRVIHIL